MSPAQGLNHFRPHPWHGLSIGPDPPRVIQAYIEITPFDLVKYESDKESGYLRVDRPQASSSLPPTLYGFIPRTFCAARVAALSGSSVEGDGDPLDVCVISERPINRADLLLHARVVGGLQMIDHGEADDKIIAVLENDTAWSEAADISELPATLIERLRHYFHTYKLVPGQETAVTIDAVYGADHAFAVIEASMADYREAFLGGA
jgi:inorganic pyrophosphatase